MPVRPESGGVASPAKGPVGVRWLAALVAGLLACTWGAPAATIFVTSTADVGPGTLRAAITAANATPVSDDINFLFAGFGPFVITVGSPLPDPVTPMNINGASQPGFAGVPLVEITTAASTFDGIVFRSGADGSEINGLRFTNFFDGIETTDPAITIDQCVVDGNVVGIMIEGSSGTVVTNTTVRSNTVGVQVIAPASDATVGSGTRVEDNGIGVEVIDAPRFRLESATVTLNAGEGVLVRNSPQAVFTDSEISFNGAAGVTLLAGSDDAVLGSPLGNRIFGNVESGVRIEAARAQLLRNVIGLDATGAPVGNGEDGVRLQNGARSATIGSLAEADGNVISGNFGNGVFLRDTATSGTVIIGNIIGLSADQSTARANLGSGVRVEADDNRIGYAPGGRNVIAGNGGYGISIQADRTLVWGNTIGLPGRGNVAGGIQAFASTGTRIGADDTRHNVIGGNGGHGIELESCSDTVIQLNRIGTDTSGTLQNANLGAGISLSGNTGTVIGGTGLDYGNLISGNLGPGIRVAGEPGVQILGNRIGSDRPGLTPIPNGGPGIEVSSANTGIIRNNAIAGNTGPGIRLFSALNFTLATNRIGVAPGNSLLGMPNGVNGIVLEGSSQNLIGVPLGGNVIAYHSGAGIVQIRGNRNRLTDNQIYLNTGPGFDLNDDGETPNDPLDPDGGANTTINFPVLSRVNDGETTVSIRLDSLPNTTYTLQLFRTIDCPFAQGRSPVDTFDIATDSSGTAAFLYTSPVPFGLGDFVTATMTDPSGNTSEFTPCNYAPSNLLAAPLFAGEDLPVGATFSLLTTVDDDNGQAYTYTFDAVPGGEDNYAFEIVGNSLRPLFPLDFETSPTLRVALRTTDNGSLPKSVGRAFLLTVQNVNEAPTDIALSNDTLPETSVVGTVVGTLATTDPDNVNGPVQTHTYTLLTGGVPFVIVGNELRVAGVLDGDTTPTYTLRIRTTDNGAPTLSTEENFTINVLGDNFPPTGLALTPTNRVDENSPAGTVVGTLVVTDPNPTQTHTLTVLNSVPFTIVGNQLRVNGALNFESQANYSVQVRVVDNGSPPFSATFSVTVVVRDVNEPPSIATSGPLEVREGDPIGFVVTTLSPLDEDIGQSHTFSISYDESGGAFSLIGTQLVLTNPSRLDYETDDFVDLYLRVQDNGSPRLSGLQWYQVRVLNSNERPYLDRNLGLTAVRFKTITLNSSRLRISDVDSPPFRLIYRLVTPPTQGTLRARGIPLGTFDVFTQQDINDQVITYTHQNFVPNQVDSFVFDFSDSSFTYDEVTSVTIGITSTNTPPLLVRNDTLTVSEFGTAAIPSTLLEAVDSEQNRSQISFIVTTLPARGILYRSGRRIGDGEFFSMQDLITGTVTYQNLERGPGTDVFEFDLTDNIETTPTTHLYSIIIGGPANTPPTAPAAVSLRVDPGSWAAFDGDDLKIVDAEQPPAELEYIVLTLPAHGQLNLARRKNLLTVGSRFTQEQVNQGDVVYVNNGDGATADSFSLGFTDGIVTPAQTITVSAQIELAVGAQGWHLYE